MTRIGIISDTHGYLDPAVFDYLSTCDQVWHAGDWGINVAEPLRAFKLTRGVYGNIDGDQIRKFYGEDLKIKCEEINVFITHIGGYPGRYEPRVKTLFRTMQPDLFISGHSHILKILRDPHKNNMLHINPGAAGKSGFQQMRTIVRLKIDGKRIFDVQVVELGKK